MVKPKLFRQAMLPMKAMRAKRRQKILLFAATFFERGAGLDIYDLLTIGGRFGISIGTYGAVTSSVVITACLPALCLVNT
jgi:hypothetical protein